MVDEQILLSSTVERHQPVNKLIFSSYKKERKKIRKKIDSNLEKIKQNLKFSNSVNNRREERQDRTEAFCSKRAKQRNWCLLKWGTTWTVLALDRPQNAYLAQVASDAHVMPGIVVELAVDGLHQSLERPRAQVDDQPHCSTLQREVDVVG